MKPSAIRLIKKLGFPCTTQDPFLFCVHHLDFYTAENDELAVTEFKKISSFDTENMSREGWISNEWHSYQNINLFNIYNIDSVSTLNVFSNK